MTRRFFSPLFILPGLAAVFLAGLFLWLICAERPPLLDGVPFSPVVLDRSGKLLRLGLAEDQTFRVRTALKDIAPEAVEAALDYEDRYFYLHPGVNPLALGRSALSMLGGSRRMGGSTLTMQVARLRLGLVTSTPGGKCLQMLRALQYEWHYSKAELLEAYFNLAPYGGNIEGIGAAAYVYFHTAAAQLTPSQSRALSLVPQNPTDRTPGRGEGFLKARGRITGDTDPLRMFSPASLPFGAPHVSAELLPLSKNGQPVRTFIDPALQRITEQALQTFAARGERYGINNAAALLIHWPTMEIRALSGSADFGNARIEGQVDGTRARRSPGSTLKPFIYALALEQGLIHPQTVLADSPRSFGGYDPENFDRQYRGPLPAQEALRSSRNLPALLLAAQITPNLYDFLVRCGVRFDYPEEHYGLSLVLGGAEVTMRELGALYAMLANKGVWRPARLSSESPADPPLPRLSPEAALVTLRMLEDPSHAITSGPNRLPLRFKTGTSNGFRDAWTAGIFGPYVMVVWVGNFDNTPNPLFVGGQAAAPLFADLAQALALAAPIRDLVPEQQKDCAITRETVCTETGDLDTSLCADTTETWYIPGRSPTRSSGVYRTILIDERTGLRACTPLPGLTRTEVWEFWPSDLARLFLQAGVVKPPPPPFGPECRDETIPGQPPRIIVPKEGLVYQRRLSDPARSAIPLTASADADARILYWFADGRFLGRSTPGEPLLWHPDTDRTRLVVTDEHGRSSTQSLTVQTLP